MVLSLASAPTLLLLMVLVILLIIEFSQFPSPNHELLLPTHSVCTPVVVTGVVLVAHCACMDTARTLESIYMVPSHLAFSWGLAAAAASLILWNPLDFPWYNGEQHFA